MAAGGDGRNGEKERDAPHVSLLCWEPRRARYCSLRQMLREKAKRRRCTASRDPPRIRGGSTGGAAIPTTIPGCLQ
jgi:hypothetical protein